MSNMQEIYDKIFKVVITKHWFMGAEVKNSSSVLRVKCSTKKSNRFLALMGWQCVAVHRQLHVEFDKLRLILQVSGASSILMDLGYN